MALASAGFAGFIACVLVSAASPPPPPGITYTNERIASGPWSIHIVRVDRMATNLALISVHANNSALGLTTLSAQLASVPQTLGTPIGGLNGDFYQRDNAHAGDPRGTQIVNGEVLSAPSGSPTFWIDAYGKPHVASVAAKFEVQWPDGRKTPFGVNGERHADQVQLYTPLIGPITHTTDGRELILEPAGTTNSPWLPLRMQESYTAKVREVRTSGKTPLGPGLMVLSVGPSAANVPRSIREGDLLKLTTASTPNLWAAQTAIGGGPVLVHDKRPIKVAVTDDESYQAASMNERHPRSAMGWNRQSFLLVEVDGRQRNLSAGMTLEELAKYLVKLGCEEAINLDGGGSSTLWFDGAVRNRPCDGRERPVANSLVVVARPSAAPTSTPPRKD